MSSEPIDAVMVHVTDISAGLEWFGRAFPNAQRMRVENSDFEFLAIDSVRLEFLRSASSDHEPGGARVVDQPVVCF